MHVLPTVAAAAVIACLAAVPLAAEPLFVNRPVPAEPDGEDRAPADAGLAEACRAEARARLVPTQRFGTPQFTSRAGRTVVRMDLVAPGQASDPARIVRAVCARDASTGAVEATVYDVPRNGAGPRIVLLRGPDPAYRPVAAPAAPASAPIVVVEGPDYNDGLYFGSDCNGCSRAYGNRPRKQRPTLGPDRLTRSGRGDVLVAPRAKVGSKRIGRLGGKRVGGFSIGR
jgi:hypothetical protein